MARRKRRSNSAPAAASSSPPPGRPLESLQHGDRLAVRDADHGYWLATFADWAWGEYSVWWRTWILPEDPHQLHLV